MVKILVASLIVIVHALSLLTTVNAAGTTPGAGSSPNAGLPPDGVPRPLAPNSTLWFQFTYGGDKTPLELRLLDGGAPDIHFALYTPDQMTQLLGGDRVKPIGQSTRVNGEPAEEIHWSGTFNRFGIYYVAINNPSALTLTVRLVAIGSSVSFPRTVIEPVVNSTAPNDTETKSADTAPSPMLPNATTLPNEPALPLPPGLVANSVPVDIPSYLGIPALSIPLTARPAQCTPANALPAQVTHSILLCPYQIYPPFTITGNNLTIYGDPNALVQGAPRGFGITVTGNNVAVVGVRVAANTHPADMNTWLCLFDACSYHTMYQKDTVHGGIGYGGGILLRNNSNASVINSVVWGGTIGVASVHSTNNKIVGSNLSNLNGWGAYLQSTEHNYVIGNTFDDVNRACVGPDGFYYQSGCESAGFACVGCQNSFVVSNECDRAGNCYYAAGDGGLASNGNRFFNDRCAGASNNCFEVTFSQGNQFDYNVASSDPATGVECAYPFWIAGSIVQFGKHNDWACTRSPKRAQEESGSSTNQPTQVNGL